jgi:hypothetical protein
MMRCLEVLRQKCQGLPKFKQSLRVRCMLWQLASVLYTVGAAMMRVSWVVQPNRN